MMPRGQYVKANMDHLLRADTLSRYQAHAIAVATGFMTRNEVREIEERQPLTPEQEREVAEATAKAAGPSGATGPTGGPNTASNQPGTGKAAPRLAAVRSAGDELPEAEPEFEPEFDGPDTWPDRQWLPGEAEAWAADDVGLSAGAAAGGLGERAAAGQEALHRYWTVGPGLAKWRGSPTPWRTLNAFLSKYMSGEQLDATTSAWYRDVFGHLPEMRPKRKSGRRR
jgi:hypothetical protein